MSLAFPSDKESTGLKHLLVDDFPKNDKWLTRGDAIEILFMTTAVGLNFPDKACCRESLSLAGSLPVGLRFDAAANPSTQLQRRRETEG